MLTNYAVLCFCRQLRRPHSQRPKHRRKNTDILTSSHPHIARIKINARMRDAARNSTPKPPRTRGLHAASCLPPRSARVIVLMMRLDQVWATSSEFPGAFPAGKNIMDIRHEQNRRASALRKIYCLYLVAFNYLTEYSCICKERQQSLWFLYPLVYTFRSPVFFLQCMWLAELIASQDPLIF